MDVETLENGNLRLPMACIHGDGMAEVEADHARVAEILAITDEHEKFEASNILYALNCWFKGRSFDLSHVIVDQWMSVAVSEFVYGETKPGENGRLIFAHCDRFEDGLARIFLYVHDNFERDE